MLYHKDKNQIMDDMAKTLSQPNNMNLNDGLIKQAKCNCTCSCNDCKKLMIDSKDKNYEHCGRKGEGCGFGSEKSDKKDDKKASLLGKLVSVADDLDSNGFSKEASLLDYVIDNVIKQSGGK